MEENRVIGERYVYKRSLGKGGNGSVFLCEDRKLQKEWAVKELSVPGKELMVLKTISCNLFPRIVDVIYEQKKVYLIMDYIEGITLKEKMNRQKLTEKEVLQWAVEIAKALHYLHQMTPQLLYMDCKPENIMLTPNGEIRLVDLGSVYVCQSDTKQRISGTKFFSPIEQQNSSRTNGTPDVRNDIYAFGMTLYYLLTGKKKEYRRKGRLCVRDENPVVSYGMSTIIARCTEREPKKRYQTVDEVLYQLTHIREADKQQKRKNILWKMVSLMGKTVCALMCLVFAKNYSIRQDVTFLTGSIIFGGVLLLFCRKQKCTVYEVKHDLFCGAGKRILIYLFLGIGIMQLMSFSVRAKESSHQKDILHVILYDSDGRKLLLQRGTVWKLSEDIILSIPLEELEEAEGEITVSYMNKNSGEIKKYVFSCCKK